MVLPKAAKMTWEMREQQRIERKLLREKLAAIEEANKQQRAEQRAVADEKRKRKEENRLKSQKYQVVCITFIWL